MATNVVSVGVYAANIPVAVGISSDRGLCTIGGFQRLSFAEVNGVLHSVPCRDNAPGNTFTANAPAVGWHELHHAAYGEADEYCCDGGYYDGVNLYNSAASCTAKASSPGTCAQIIKPDGSGLGWWRGDTLTNDVMVANGPEDLDDVRAGIESTTSAGATNADTTSPVPARPQPARCAARPHPGRSGRRSALGAAGADETNPPAPADPLDARHVTLELAVTDDPPAPIGQEVGVASGHPADGQAIRLRLVDHKGATLAEVGLNDPLERHIYAWPYQLVNTEQPRPVAHETDYLTSATTTVAVPLLPHLAAIEISRLDYTGRTRHHEVVDVIDQLSRACAQDAHLDCRVWSDSRP